jgi:hypothetical protein
MEMYKFKTKTIDIVYAFSTWITVFCVLVIFMYFIKPDFFKGENTNQHQQKVKEELSHTFQDTVKREGVKCYSESNIAIQGTTDRYGCYGTSDKYGLHCNSTSEPEKYNKWEGSQIEFNENIPKKGIYPQAENTISYIKPIQTTEERIQALEKQIKTLKSKIEDLEFQERINRGR